MGLEIETYGQLQAAWVVETAGLTKSFIGYERVKVIAGLTVKYVKQISPEAQHIFIGQGKVLRIA